MCLFLGRLIETLKNCAKIVKGDEVRIYRIYFEEPKYFGTDKENRNLFQEMITEALEDVGLLRAMEIGRKTKLPAPSFHPDHHPQPREAHPLPPLANAIANHLVSDSAGDRGGSPETPLQKSPFRQSPTQP